MSNPQLVTTGAQATSDHKLFQAHTESKNFWAFFKAIEKAIKEAPQFKTILNSLDFHFGKDEIAISVMGDTWKPDLVVTYNKIPILVTEAFTTDIKAGKTVTINESGKTVTTKFSSIDETPAIRSLEHPDVKSSYDGKLALFMKTKLLVDQEKWIDPVKSLHHHITIDSDNEARMVEVVNHYVNAINPEFLNSILLGNYSTFVISRKRESQIQPMLVSGLDFLNLINSIVDQLTTKIQEIDNTPDAKGIKLPLGSQFNAEQAKKEIAKSKVEIKTQLKELKLFGSGCMSDFDVALFRYGSANMKEVLNFT